MEQCIIPIFTSYSENPREIVELKTKLIWMVMYRIIELLAPERQVVRSVYF
jgi:hypothetical protein